MFSDWFVCQRQHWFIDVRPREQDICGEKLWSPPSPSPPPHYLHRCLLLKGPSRAGGCIKITTGKVSSGSGPETVKSCAISNQENYAARDTRGYSRCQMGAAAEQPAVETETKSPSSSALWWKRIWQSLRTGNLFALNIRLQRNRVTNERRRRSRRKCYFWI